MTTSLVSENDVYKYLGLAFIVLIVIYFIHKMVEAQSNVVEGITNREETTINDLLPRLKDAAHKCRSDLHLTEDREKIEDVIIAYKALLGCKMLKTMTTTDFSKNPQQLMVALAGYNQDMEGIDKLINHLDRLKDKSENDKNSSLF